MKRYAPLLAAVALAFLLALALGGKQSLAEQEAESRASTFFSNDSGTRAVYLVLSRLFGAARVQQLRGTVREEVDTLIVCRPLVPLEEREYSDLEDWLKHGGRLILLSGDGWPLAQSNVRAANFLARHGVVLSEAPSSPGEVTAAGLKLWTSEGARWKGKCQPWTRSDGGARLAVRIAVGQGEIIAVADDHFLDNSSLRKGDNAVWLARQGLHDGVTAFDELHQGFGERTRLATVIGRFLVSPWGWAFLQMGAAGLLYLLLVRSRLGRVVRTPAQQAPDPLRLLRHRASLFRLAEAATLALDQICLQLCHQLRGAAGRPADLGQVEELLRAAGRSQGAEAARRLREQWQRAREGARLTRAQVAELAQLAPQIREEVASVAKGAN